MTSTTFPELAVKAPEVTIISHSGVLYWWPVWVVGYLMALVSYLQGETMTSSTGAVDYIHPSNNPGLIFVALLVLLIVFTNARLRGIYSVVTIVTVGFFVVLLAYLGWWDDIFAFIPYLSARASAGFYLVLATTVLAVWLASVLVFDRFTYWRVRPGQVSEISLVGGGTHNYDMHGVRFERREQDWFRHILLGFGAGDLLLSGRDLPNGLVMIPNVSFVAAKARDIERLVVIKPDG